MLWFLTQSKFGNICKFAVMVDCLLYIKLALQSGLFQGVMAPCLARRTSDLKVVSLIPGLRAVVVLLGGETFNFRSVFHHCEVNKCEPAILLGGNLT